MIIAHPVCDLRVELAGVFLFFAHAKEIRVKSFSWRFGRGSRPELIQR